MLSNNTVSQWLNLRGTRKCSYMHIEMLTSLLEERARLYDLEKVSAISRVKKDYVSIPRAKINFYLDFVKKKKVRRTDLSLAQLAARAEVNEHSLYNWRRYTQTAAKEDICRVFETVEKIYPDVLGKWRLLSAELGFQDVGRADEKSE